MVPEGHDLYLSGHADHHPDALGYPGCSLVLLCEFDVGGDLLTQYRALVWDDDTGLSVAVRAGGRLGGALRIGRKVTVGPPRRRRVRLARAPGDAFCRNSGTRGAEATVCAN